MPTAASAVPDTPLNSARRPAPFVPLTRHTVFVSGSQRRDNATEVVQPLNTIEHLICSAKLPMSNVSTQEYRKRKFKQKIDRVGDGKRIQSTKVDDWLRSHRSDTSPSKINLDGTEFLSSDYFSASEDDFSESSL